MVVVVYALSSRSLQQSLPGPLGPESTVAFRPLFGSSVSAILVRIDHVESILNFRIGFSWLGN